MSAIEKTEQIDHYLQEIGEKENANLKKKIGAIIGIGLLIILVFWYVLSINKAPDYQLSDSTQHLQAKIAAPIVSQEVNNEEETTTANAITETLDNNIETSSNTLVSATDEEEDQDDSRRLHAPHRL